MSDSGLPDASWRQWLVQADHTASRDFDKAILTLAAGGLGLSIAFVHQLAPQPQRLAWLKWSWLLLSLSMLLILASFLTSQHALRREIASIDLPEQPLRPPGGWPGLLTVGLNWAAAVTLMTGVGALLWFAHINL